MSKILLSRNEREWIVEQAYTCFTGYFSNGREVIVNIYEGYNTDLASVPRIFRGIINIDELSIEAVVVHDFLYENRGQNWTISSDGHFRIDYDLTRKDVDKIFYILMKRNKISLWRRKLAYWAVRMFGGPVWRK